MIKEFQFIYKGIPFSSEDKRFNYHKFTCTLDRLLDSNLAQLTAHHNICELIAKRQYTGLKDVSGTKVFEGDIIELKTGERIVIEYSKTDFTFIGWVESIWEYETLPFFLGYKDFKVVGNIYENPEFILKAGVQNED